MKKGIIGKKIGMTQVFDEQGHVIPVTVIQAGPCVVVQKKTEEKDGYNSVQLGYGALKEKHATKPLQGHFEKADVAAKRVLKEFSNAGCVQASSLKKKILHRRCKVQFLIRNCNASLNYLFEP